MKHKNNYEIVDNYVIGYTPRNRNKFYFDLEDFEIIKQYYWIIDSEGNVVCKNKKPRLTMHKLIMGDGIYLHKNGNNSDNRKENIIPARGGHNNGKTYLNGYIAIYMPEHERAFENGCVYEHILVAEKILGRKLKEDECVHHKDKDRTNNSPDNLMVFQTNEDHIAFHGGAEAILDDEGTYYCIRNHLCITYYYNNRTKEHINNGKIDVGSVVSKIYNMDICPVCNVNHKHVRSKMCLECRNKDKAKNIPAKEELEKLIYKMSFLQIGKQYRVSDNTVRKWCKKYELPYKREDIKLIKNTEV